MRVFFPVTAWRTLATNIVSSLGKGYPVVVVGQWTADSWKTEEGEERHAQWILARHVGPDLSRCSADVIYERKTAAQASEPADPFDQD